MSPAYGLGVSFEAGRKAAFRARYHFNGTLDLGRFGTAEEAQRAYDQAILSINAQHYRATNFSPGTLTAFSEDVDDRIRRHLSALGLESAYRAPATWLNQPAAGGHADPAAAPAPAPPAPAAASGPAPAAPPAAAPAAASAAAGDSLPMAAMQDGGLGQHSGFLHGFQDADMSMMAVGEMSAGSSATDMQPVPELDALLQADMDADSSDFAALLDEIFTDSTPVPAAAEAAFGAVGMQQQGALLLLSAGTACPPAAAAGWTSSSGAAAQQQFKVLLGGSVGCSPAAAAAGPSNVAATPLQYDTMQRFRKQQWQLPAPGSPFMGSPAAQGAASVQQQQPGVSPAGFCSGFLAQAAGASQYSTSSGDLAPAAAAGAAAGFGVCAHAHARAPAAAGAAFNHHLQQPSSLAALASVGELVLFVDTSILHLTQLYSMCMLLAASGHQYAGMVAIDWVTRLRSRLSSSGAVGALVASLVMRLCSNLTAIASAHPAGAFDSAFLVVVLEQLILALLELRALCAGPQAAQGLGSILHTWRLQLQAGAGTRLGLAVLEALSELCGMWN